MPTMPKPNKIFIEKEKMSYCGHYSSCRCSLCTSHKPCCKKGPTGPEGPQGPPGESPTSAYGYVFNTGVTQVVGPGEAVFFNGQGFVSDGVFIDGDGFGIATTVTGAYSVTWTVTAAEENAFELVLNDVSVIGTFQTAGNGQVNVGQFILPVPVVDGIPQVIRLVNVGNQDVTLIGGGVQRVNASIMIHKLN